MMYHQTFSSQNSQNLNVSRLALQLSLPNVLKPGVTSRMEIKAILQLQVGDQQF